MSRFRLGLGVVLVLAGTCGAGRAAAGDAGVVTKAEYEQLQKEVEELRKKISASQPVGGTRVDDIVAEKYGPNATVTTRQGRLTLGGLVQVWYYSIQNDNVGYVNVREIARHSPPGTPLAFGSNEVADNDSFRIRRAELKFTMDIHENVTAVVMIDPAREAASFPNFPSNLGNGISGDADVYYDAGFGSGNPRNDAVRYGSGLASRILQDAYISFHGIIPHHDVQVGQMKRRLGEEGTRDSSALDFAERAMITQPADLRDAGILLHGAWWDDRFQYWAGSFNGSGTAFQQRQNRADDNDEKDLVASLLLRPLWKDEKFGSIELGYSILVGVAGEAAGHFPADHPVDGLNRRVTSRLMQYAYLSYLPGGPVKGWWMRGEWGMYRDRFAPLEVGGGIVRNPATFDVQGWYVATGYKLMDSIWADSLNAWLKPVEFAFRYEVMENLFLPDLVAPERRTDEFKTQVFTAGMNYYIKGHNAKLQLNYNWVDEEVREANDARPVREVRNDNLIVNFQVAW